MHIFYFIKNISGVCFFRLLFSPSVVLVVLQLAGPKANNHQLVSCHEPRTTPTSTSLHDEQNSKDHEQMK